MPVYPKSPEEQIKLIEGAMKQAGVWSDLQPSWINAYNGGRIENYWEWLQFIHLPERLKRTDMKPGYLAPQLSKFIDTSPEHQYILQLVIELDSLTSTIERPANI